MKLLSEIFSTDWLISQKYKNQVAPVLLSQLIKGNKIDANEGMNVRANYNDDKEDDYYGWALKVIDANGKELYVNSYNEAPSGSVAVVALDGPTMLSDGMCSMGTETLGKILKSADKSPKITGIIALVNSGGGQVKGMFELSEVVRGLIKPNVARVYEGCSAAYNFAAAFNHVQATSPTAIVGSIGVMSSFADFSQQLEAMGVRLVDVYADGSEEKNSEFSEALAGDTDKLKFNILNPIREQFASNMREYRGLGEDALTGRVYIASEGLQAGLVDSIGDMEDALIELESQRLNLDNLQSMNTEERTLMAKIKSALNLSSSKAEEAEQVETVLDLDIGASITVSHEKDALIGASVSLKDDTYLLADGRKLLVNGGKIESIQEVIKDEENIDLLKAKNENLSSKLDALNADLAKYKGELEALKAANTELKADNSEMYNTLKTISSKMPEIKQQATYSNKEDNLGNKPNSTNVDPLEAAAKQKMREIRNRKNK